MISPVPPPALKQSHENSLPVVCHVLHSLNVGGAEVLAAGMARSLSDNFRFVFACLDELGPLGRELQQAGFNVRVLGRRPGIDWRCSRALRRFCLEENVRLIHAHQYTPFFQCLLSRLPGTSTKIIFTEHGRHHPDHPRKKRIWCNRMLVRSTDQLVGVGESVRQALIVNEGLPADRVRVIYNGVPLDSYATIHKSPLRNELGIDPQEFVVMTVARLSPAKDHKTGLAAIQHLHQQGLKTHWILAGDGPERAELERLVDGHHLRSHVHFLGTRHDVPELLPAADVFMLCSITEGIPLTVIEAMAAQVPVAATKVGGLQEMINDRVNGLLTPPQDSHALGESLRILKTDGELRQSIVTAGKVTAENRFSWDGMIQAYADLYQEVLRHDR